MNGARTTPWEGLVHCTGTVLDMEAVEDIDEACWLTITVDTFYFLLYTSGFVKYDLYYKGSPGLCRVWCVCDVTIVLQCCSAAAQFIGIIQDITSLTIS